MRPLHAALVSGFLFTLTACAAVVPDAGDDDDASQFGRSDSALSSAMRRTRAGQIRDAAQAAGITEGYLLAGIADSETSMAHCHSELTWACRGPYSADCGGAVVAGAGDGPCSIRQGGLGMFQFDAGNYDQTIAREGSRVLSIAGNVAAAVDFVVNMVIRSTYIAGVDNRGQAIAWINGVRIDNGRFGPWIRTVTHYYNGCRPGYSCFTSRYARYRDHTTNVYREMGATFWQAAVCEAGCVDGTRIRDARCGEGDCAAYGATCVDDDLGARCVSAFCPARGEGQTCIDDDQILTCRNGAHVGIGSCGAFGARCVDDALGARCASVLCEPLGEHYACLDDDQLLHCQDGAPSAGSCGAYGATCVEDDLGARCVSVFCEPRGESTSCFPDSNVLLSCRDGGIVENGDCGAFGATCVDDELGARCVSVFCEPTGVQEACVPGEVRITCEDGGIVDSADCGADGGVCVHDGEVARCVNCPATGRSRHCAGEVAVERCEEGIATIDECPSGTACGETVEGAASCVPTSSPSPEPAAGPAPEPTRPDGAGFGRGSLVSGGCSATRPGAGAGLWPLFLILSLLAVRRLGRGVRT